MSTSFGGGTSKNAARVSLSPQKESSRDADQPPRQNSSAGNGRGSSKTYEKKQGGPAGATRSSEVAESVTNHRWEKGPVWIRIRHKDIDGTKDTFEWVRGEIVEVSTMPCSLDRQDFGGKVVVRIRSDDSTTFVSPNTWCRNCPGSIPLEESDKFRTSDWIKRYDKFHHETLDKSDRYIHRVLKSNKGRIGPDKLQESSRSASSLDDILLRDRHGLAINDQIDLLMQKPEVATIVDLANGGNGMKPTAVYGIAFLFGQMVGTELSRQSASQDQGKDQSCNYIDAYMFICARF